MEKLDLKSQTLEELSALMKEWKEPAFRAGQIFEWLYRGVRDFEEMTNLSKSLREKLREKTYINQITIENKLVSTIDGTVKYLYRLEDGECIETVLMRYDHGNSICLSTEVGCAMGCGFCASTIGGLRRRLHASEILDQILETQRDIGERVDSVVLMGIGEPLDNFEAVVTFLKNANHPKGLGIGMRHFTLSTCGLVDQIDELAKLELPITLAISLHAAKDDQRSTIMPINKKWPLAELISACHRYIQTTGRRITFEFALISEVNDDLETAEELTKLLSGMLCHVNLIPVNPVEEKNFEKPDREKIDRFCQHLEKRGIPATVRRKLGADIQASCGQLRRKREADIKGGQNQ